MKQTNLSKHFPDMHKYTKYDLGRKAHWTEKKTENVEQSNKITWQQYNVHPRGNNYGSNWIPPNESHLNRTDELDLPNMGHIRSSP